MTPLLSVTDLEARLPAGALPLDEVGQIDTARVTLALEDATGIIVTHLPWLLDADTGDIVSPLPGQFAESVVAICADIAFFRLSDRVSSSEDDRDRYKENVKLLNTIAKEHKGGLMGPDHQEASIVEPNEEEGITDSRFFKKGEIVG